MPKPRDDVVDAVAGEMAKTPVWKAEVPNRKSPSRREGGKPEKLVQEKGQWRSERGSFGKRKNSKRELGAEKAAFEGNDRLMAKAIHGRLRDGGMEVTEGEVGDAITSLRENPAPIKQKRVDSRIASLDGGLKTQRKDVSARLRWFGRRHVEAGGAAVGSVTPSKPKSTPGPSTKTSNPFFGKPKPAPATTSVAMGRPGLSEAGKAPAKASSSAVEPYRPRFTTTFWANAPEEKWAEVPEEKGAKRAKSHRVATAAKWSWSTLSVGTSRGRDHWREFTGLWMGRRGGLGANLTFLGKMVVKLPAGLPAMAIALLAVGVVSLAAGFVIQDEDMGLGEYTVHTVSALVASVANLGILLTNAIIAGVTSFFKVFLLSGIVIVNDFFHAIFNALYGAVNKLIDFTNLGDPIQMPAFNQDKVQSGSPLHLAYLAPTSFKDCGGSGPFSVVNVVNGTVECSTDGFVTTKPFLGSPSELFDIPAAPRFQDLPEIAWDGLVSMYEAARDGTTDFMSWLERQVTGVFS